MVFALLQRSHPSLSVETSRRVIMCEPPVSLTPPPPPPPPPLSPAGDDRQTEAELPGFLLYQPLQLLQPDGNICDHSTFNTLPAWPLPQKSHCTVTLVQTRRSHRTQETMQRYKLSWLSSALLLVPLVTLNPNMVLVKR